MILDMPPSCVANHWPIRPFMLVHGIHKSFGHSLITKKRGLIISLIHLIRHPWVAFFQLLKQHTMIFRIFQRDGFLKAPLDSFGIFTCRSQPLRNHLSHQCSWRIHSIEWQPIRFRIIHKGFVIGKIPSPIGFPLSVNQKLSFVG